MRLLFTLLTSIFFVAAASASQFEDDLAVIQKHLLQHASQCMTAIFKSGEKVRVCLSEEEGKPAILFETVLDATVPGPPVEQYRCNTNFSVILKASSNDTTVPGGSYKLTCPGAKQLPDISNLPSLVQQIVHAVSKLITFVEGRDV